MFPGSFGQERAYLHLHLRLPQIPGAVDLAFDGRFGEERLLLRQELDRPAAHDRLQLQPRVHLGVDRAIGRDLHVAGHDDVAVAAHQRHRLVAEHARELLAEDRLADQDVGLPAALLADVVDRHAAAEKPAHVIDRLHQRLGHAERHHRRRVRVDDRMHVGPGLVDLAVDVALEEAARGLGDRPARCRDRTRRCRPR